MRNAVAGSRVSKSLQKNDFSQPFSETKFFHSKLLYEANVRYFEWGPLAPDLNWPGSDPLCRHKEKKMYTELQYQFENRKIRTTMSKLVGVPIFATLLSLLAEKQLNAARNEYYIIIIKKKLLFHFCCRLLHKFRMGEKRWIFFGILVLTWWSFAEVFLALSALLPISHGFFIFSLCHILKKII